MSDSTEDFGEIPHEDECEYLCGECRQKEEDSLIEFHTKIDKFGGVKGHVVSISQIDLITKFLEELASLGGYLGIKEYRKNINVEGLYEIGKPYPGLLKLIGGSRMCFELFPQTMYLYRSNIAEDSIIVLTNRPSTKLTIDELFNAAPVIAKTSREECVRITHQFDQIGIYPVGSYHHDGNKKIPAALDRAIWNEGLSHVF